MISGVSESSTIDHNKMLEDILRGMKEGADLAEECLVGNQKAVERAIQHAEHAKVTAERLRKTAEDTEKARRANPIPGIDTFHQRALEDTLRGMKEAADLAEECLVGNQKAVERAIQHAEHARVTAERLRKTAEDTEKARRANPIPGIDTFHQRTSEDTLRGMKEAVDLAEECLVGNQKAVERAIQHAEHARVTAERLRKTAEDTEKARRANPIPGIDTFHQRALEDTLRGMKEAADLAEECLVGNQKAVERAIQHAEHARVTAERLRKTAEDTEKARRANPIPGIDTFHQRALEDTLRGMK